jgi:hypothetical protein
MEGTVRAKRADLTFWGVDYRPEHFVFDLAVGYKYQPNTEFKSYSPDGPKKTNINSLGYRSPYEPDGTAYDVLVIGDSMTAGQQVLYDQTSTAVAEKILREKRDPATRMVNGGIAGHQPFSYLFSYQANLRKYKPRVVIVGLYLGNDFIQDTLDENATSPFPHHKVGGIHTLKNWIIDHSYLANLILGKIVERNNKRAEEKNGKPVWPPVPKFLEISRGVSITPEQFFGVRHELGEEIRFLGPLQKDGWPADPFAQRCVAKALGRLSALKNQCAKDGVEKFAVMIIPSRLMTNAKTVKEANEMAARGFLPHAPVITGRELSKSIETLLNERGIETINLHEKIISKKENPAAFFWPVD